MGKRCPLCKRPLKDEYKEAVQKLGLSGWAKDEITPEVIKKAYRSIVHTCHPDKGGDAEAFAEVTKAKDHLKDVVSDDPKPKKKLRLSKTEKQLLRDKFQNFEKGKACPLCGKK